MADAEKSMEIEGEGVRFSVSDQRRAEGQYRYYQYQQPPYPQPFLNLGFNSAFNLFPERPEQSTSNEMSPPVVNITNNEDNNKESNGEEEEEEDDDSYDDEADNELIERNRRYLLTADEVDGDASEKKIDKESVIEAVRPYPPLWQATHPKNKDQAHKKLIWMKIQNENFKEHHGEEILFSLIHQSSVSIIFNLVQFNFVVKTFQNVVNISGMCNILEICISIIS